VRTDPPTVREALAAATGRLRQLDDTDPRLDSEALLAQVLGCTRAWLYAWPEHRLEAEQSAAFDALVAERARGVPVAHLVGSREFWSLALRVTPDTLIPRPDTEMLVEWALELVPRHGRTRLLDLGTGTGAIALALASEREHAEVTATDRSSAALAVAADNARRLGLPQVRFVGADWLEPFAADARFDLIVGNPPYVALGDPHLDRGDVAHEPRSALAAGPDGLDDLQRILDSVGNHLAPGGWLLLEHGPDQGAAARALFATAGLTAVETRRDLGARERVTGGRRPRGKP
jgi:release factor glutamine methyltransferase